MKQTVIRGGFTLIELMVALTITLVLAGVMLVATTGTLNLWRRTQDDFSAAAQAKLVLDYVERDLQSAVFRSDGQNWLALDVINNSGTLTNHGWLSASPMKPATAESQRYLPTGVAPSIAEARFGLSGVWLRFIATNIDSAGSVPVAVAYQIARRPVSGTIVATTQADVRYTLFRSAVAAEKTFTAGYDVLGASYSSTGAQPQSARDSSTLTNPNTTSDVIATNVVDFGVWLYSRGSSGSLTMIYPTGSGDTSHVANGPASFPAVADVMVRILTEEGARLIEAMESSSGALTRPPLYASDADWWWAVVEAHSRVVVRRVEIKGVAL